MKKDKPLFLVFLAGFQEIYPQKKKKRKKITYRKSKLCIVHSSDVNVVAASSQYIEP